MIPCTSEEILWSKGLGNKTQLAAQRQRSICAREVLAAGRAAAGLQPGDRLRAPKLLMNSSSAPIFDELMNLFIKN